MKRFLCMAAIIALLPLSAYGWMMVGRGTVSGGGTCVSGSVDSEVTTNSGGIGLYSNDSCGNSFTVTEAGTLYSIVITLVGSGTYGTLEMRIDNDSDLSSDAIVTKTVTGASAGDVEFIFDSNPSLSTGTTYYWAVMQTVSDSTPYLRYRAGDVDAGRSLYNTDGWSLGTYNIDRTFMEKIKLCD